MNKFEQYKAWMKLMAGKFENAVEFNMSLGRPFEPVTIRHEAALDMAKKLREIASRMAILESGWM